MHTSASSLFLLQFRAITPHMSRIWPLISMRWGLSRPVPRTVPPVVRIPASARLSRRSRESSASPRKPSRKPMTSMPHASAALPTPRMAAFRPGLSPPAVMMPIRLAMPRMYDRRSEICERIFPGGPGSELFPQGAVFLLEIVDHIMLLLVHPTDERDEHESHRRRQRDHGTPDLPKGDGRRLLVARSRSPGPCETGT